MKRWLIALMLGVLSASPAAQAEYADVTINRLSDKNGVRPVIFPHWFHRLRFTCNVCHNDSGFKMRAGSNEINMAEIVDGRFCGMCHDDKIAWGPENCDRCHSGKPKLPTGVQGGNETGGPGRW